MDNWNPKKVSGEYNPDIGANVPVVDDFGNIAATESYADIDYLRRLINTLLEEAKFLGQRLEEDMLNYSLLVGDHDSRLVESHRKEWPPSLGEVKDRVSYRYYKALRFRNTTSAAYIRARYEEGARGVTGTNAIDVLEVVKIIRDETLLIQEFLNANIGNVDDSSEFRILELFQDWVHSAIGNIREFWAFFEAGEAPEELLDPAEINRTTPDEAKRGQVVFKVKLNAQNSTIQKDLDFLKRNFSEFAPDFYVRFLGPALRYRLQVGRQTFPTGNRLMREIEEASSALDANLRTVIGDQLRRTELFTSKMKAIRDNMRQRDKYRSYIVQLAFRGNPLPASGPNVMVWETDTAEEVDYWVEEELQFESSISEDVDDSGEVTSDTPTPISPVVPGTFVASHGELENLLADDHPQYLLRSGGTITGNIFMGSGATIDGMRPSTHRHTGLDGSPQIDGKDIILDTLPEKAVDTRTRPETPVNLAITGYRLNSRPPGVTVVDTTLEWDGNQEYNYEVQIVLVRD